jgi:hypothetical protein
VIVGIRVAPPRRRTNPRQDDGGDVLGLALAHLLTDADRFAVVSHNEAEVASRPILLVRRERLGGDVAHAGRVVVLDAREPPDLLARLQLLGRHGEELAANE